MSDQQDQVGSPEFQAFPQAKVQQVEARQRDKVPYKSPHAPQKPRVSGANMVATGMPAPAAASIPEPTRIPDHMPVITPGFTAPTSEEEAVVLALPSQYIFYDFKDLYVKPFKGRNLGKLSRAKEERSTLHMVEAVSSVLSNTRGDQHIGFKLTLPDFYFVLYWLRLNSFTKSVFIHESQCTNPDHIERVTNGELGSDTLLQAEVINKSSVKTVMLEQAPNLEAFVLDYPGVTLAQATMQDAIEMTEDPNFDQEEFRYAAQKAVYLRGLTPIDPQDHAALAQYPSGLRPMTLVERVSIVDDMSADDHIMIQSYEKATGEYGIVEQIKVTCKGCGASKVDKITIDAHSFFPSGS